MKRVDISRSGNAYENACQTILQRFIEWGKNKKFEDIFPTRPNGKKRLSDKAHKELIKLDDDINPTGAMFWSAVSHFGYIKKKGYDAWIKLGQELDRLIDWNPENNVEFSIDEALQGDKKIGDQADKWIEKQNKPHSRVLFEEVSKGNSKDVLCNIFVELRLIKELLEKNS